MPQSSLSERTIIPLEMRLAFLVMMIITLLLTTQRFYPSVALAYSCPETGTHCYGYNDWQGAMNGAKTTIYTVPLSCSGCSTWDGVETGFVDDEMWVADPSSNQCIQNQYDSCWVEAGYSTFGGWFGNSTVNYFWADNRPTGGYYEHTLSQVPATDYWEYTTYSISRASSNSFEVDIFNGFDFGYTSYSTYNTMYPNDIRIGQELAGSGGASAPTANFANNIWIGTDSSNTQHYQTGNGNITSRNPPYAGYTIPPQKSSTGGVIFTHCC